MFQRLERSPGKGYQLYELGTMWEIHHSRGVFRGTLQSVITYAIIELGFEFKELDTAVMAMEEKFHNGAEFGVLRSFMFTFDKEERFKNTSTNN